MNLKTLNLQKLSIVASIILLNACNTLPEKYISSNSLETQDLLDGTVLLGEKIKQSELPDDKVMEITEEMEVFLKDYVLRANGPENRANLLSRALFDDDKLNLEYDPSQTFTAREAFENKVANCIAFSLLYITLADRLGLDATFQEVLILPEWGEAEDGTYIESRHVNVNLYIHGSGQWVVDIDSIGKNLNLRATPLEKEHAQALYYGNVASELMLDKKYKEAFRYFVKAIELEPSEASIWSNLGVLYRRVGLDEYAEKAYFIALDYETRNASALNNLAYLYKASGKNDRSEYYEKLAKASQVKNPYFRYSRAQAAFDKYQFDLAEKHINYAIRKNKSEPSFYDLKSKIHEMLGERIEASKAFKIAQRLRAEAP